MLETHEGQWRLRIRTVVLLIWGRAAAGLLSDSIFWSSRRSYWKVRRGRESSDRYLISRWINAFVERQEGTGIFPGHSCFVISTEAFWIRHLMMTKQTHKDRKMQACGRAQPLSRHRKIKRSRCRKLIQALLDVTHKHRIRL
jgi:hypothetical protein